MLTPTLTYVLLTPARNEAGYIRGTLDSVVHQTHKPLKWVVVSDGSTDETDDIIQHYAAKYDFIHYLRTEPQQEARAFASKAYALHAAAQQMDGLRYDLMGNLDADVSFAPDYFAQMLQRFAADEQLGVGGGVIVEDHNGVIIPQHNATHLNVAGAVQLFRRECFEQIGGYRPLPRGGIDALADIMARLYGWKVQTFSELEVMHHRLTGTEQSSLLKARIRQGYLENSFGYHPLFELVKCLSRVREKPYVLGSLYRFWGFMQAKLKGERAAIPPEARAFLRQEQLARLLPFVSPPSPISTKRT